MPRTLGRLWLGLVLATIAAWPAVLPVSASRAGISALADTPIRSMYVRAPHGAAAGKPLQVLLALHGMGGNGEDFARDLTEQADQHGWLLVAPTIQYADWTNPNVVAREEPVLIRALSDYLDQLPEIFGLQTRRLILVLGHSRGAQLAHRFAEFRPDRVLAVAALGAGAYTLPQMSGPQGSFSFPFGIKDLSLYAGHTFDQTRFAGVAFWVGVGSQDTNPADLPRQWDAIEGTTRVARAQAFETAMQRLGANVVLREFGNARHEVTREMRMAACEFLEHVRPVDTSHVISASDQPVAY